MFSKFKIYFILFLCNKKCVQESFHFLLCFVPNICPKCFNWSLNQLNAKYRKQFLVTVLGISLQLSVSKHSAVTSQDLGEKVSYSFSEAWREGKFEWFEQPTQFTCVHKNTQRPILAHKHTRFLSSSHTHTHTTWQA